VRSGNGRSKTYTPPSRSSFSCSSSIAPASISRAVRRLTEGKARAAPTNTGPHHAAFSRGGGHKAVLIQDRFHQGGPKVDNAGDGRRSNTTRTERL